MTNTDTSKRVSDEMDARKLHGPYKTDPFGNKIYGTDDRGGGSNTVLDVRGWGYLTGRGHGGLGMDDNPALKEQQRFAAFVVDALNAAESTRSTPGTGSVEEDDADLASDEKWNAGVNYAIERLCQIFDVDPKSISWDAATETLDGDVMSVLCNVLVAAYGEEWSSQPRDTVIVRAALLSASKEPEGWRDIASAPKDETEILGWTPQGCSIVYWVEASPIYPDDPGMDAGWLARDGTTCPGCPGYSTEAQNVPTHWRPLPTAPEQEG